MAIREFGESLLADVRARKDQQSSDQRKEDRKAERSQLKGAALGFIAKEGLGIIKNNMEQKTQDFFARSNLYDNKVIVDKGIKEAEEMLTHINLAEKQGITLPSYFRNLDGTTALAQYKIKNPLKVKKNEDAAYKAILMERPQAIEYANERAAYALRVKDLGEAAVKGRGTMSLTEIGKQVRPSSLTQSFVNKVLRRDISSVEAFNKKMELVDQVVASNSILAEKVALAKSFANKGNLFLAGLAQPDLDSLFENEGKRLKQFLEDGTLISDVKPESKIVDGRLVEIAGGQVKTAPDGTKTYITGTNEVVVESELDQLEEQRLLASKAAVNTSLIATFSNLTELGASIWNQEGQENLQTHLDKNYGDPTKWTSDTFLKLALEIATGKTENGGTWTQSQNSREKLTSADVTAINAEYKPRLEKINNLINTYRDEESARASTDAVKKYAREEGARLTRLLENMQLEIVNRIAARNAQLNEKVTVNEKEFSNDPKVPVVLPEPEPEGEIIETDSGRVYKTPLGSYPIEVTEDGKTFYRIGAQYFQIKEGAGS